MRNRYNPEIVSLSEPIADEQLLRASPHEPFTMEQTPSELVAQSRSVRQPQSQNVQFSHNVLVVLQIYDLNNDMLEKIFKEFLSVKDLASVTRVCKKFRDIGQARLFTKYLGTHPELANKAITAYKAAFKSSLVLNGINLTDDDNIYTFIIYKLNRDSKLRSFISKVMQENTEQSLEVLRHGLAAIANRDNISDQIPADGDLVGIHYQRLQAESHAYEIFQREAAENRVNTQATDTLESACCRLVWPRFGLPVLLISITFFIFGILKNNVPVISLSFSAILITGLLPMLFLPDGYKNYRRERQETRHLLENRRFFSGSVQQVDRGDIEIGLLELSELSNRVNEGAVVGAGRYTPKFTV